MRVKIMTAFEFDKLEDYINEFIEDKKVIDITYQTEAWNNEDMHYSALISYI